MIQLMNKISNKEGCEHENVSYPLIDRRAIVYHRRWCHCLAVGWLHQPGEKKEEGDNEQSVHSQRTHLLSNCRFFSAIQRGENCFEVLDRRRRWWVWMMKVLNVRLYAGKWWEVWVTNLDVSLKDCSNLRGWPRLSQGRNYFVFFSPFIIGEKMTVFLL